MRNGWANSNGASPSIERRQVRLNQLDLLSAPRPGFRLVRFEVLNWGTFHKQVWGLDADGNNLLLTGDIGSGKSTLVDGITALLVPRVNFNKAAGAASGERSTETYFFGRYKAERGEPGLSSKPVSLRGPDSYSVLLARFHNEALAQHVTLAQVFWAKAPQGPPLRFFVVADKPLSIKEHFSAFGQDINTLKKRLRAMPQVELFDTFPPYGAAWRRRFGIENEQAMDLFHQTISMKSVGNLTDFVREHMLEASAVEERIQALIGHYQDLDRAHELVQKARWQIGFLSPVVADCDQRDAVVAEVELLRGCRDALRPWFAGKKRALLEKRLANLDAELDKLAHRISASEEMRGLRLTERDAVRQAIAEHGGDRIEQIKREIAAKRLQKDERAQRAARYDERSHALGLAAALDSAAFLANQRAIREDRAAADAAHAEAQNALTEAAVELRQLQRQYEEIEAELQSLYRRRSNIPRQILEIRAELCRTVELREEELPFAGELLQVRPEERAWEGAIERLLHNFALSLLVRDEQYARVAEWVERTHLDGRLVYFRVLRAKAADHASLHPASLVRKLAIKPESGFYAWLDAELAARFNYACCETLDQFRREPQAVTRAGQTKGRGERHEKDDRHRIDDRSRYVLGWSNEQKIEALRRDQRNLEARRAPLVARIRKFEQHRDSAQNRKMQLAELAMFEDFRELDWRPVVAEIEHLEKERRELEEGSDVLRTLQQQLATIDTAIRETESRLRADTEEQARLRERRRHASELAAECDAILAGAIEELFPRLETMSAEGLGAHTLTVESCDGRERQMREWMQSRIDSEDKRIRALGERIVRAMQAYRSRYPLETQEADASVEAAGEFRAMLSRLLADDLPRFEQQFKSLLNENTIREVANFHSQLNRERETIRERIETINRSLRGIDYNAGRYILLEASPNADQEIRDFVASLRACTEGSLTGREDESYSEAKFVQVKRIIERFRGREGSGEIDRCWTAKVTDVRQWFTFSASERWREDDREFEHYTDSGGKSGGQKEKLAYTVLAASLAYQFGLEMDAPRKRSFRFVVIDEAFGRGSDESARYGLELFGRLDLQLLIVTPLQKIHIIEPFIAGVGFVHNEDGRISMLRNLTIEEYRAERAARAG
jgi:uncharacterized protein YPO0396